MNRFIHALLAEPIPNSRKPEEVQTSPTPVTVVHPDQGNSTTQCKDTSMCSFMYAELACTCSLGFSQQPRLKPGSEDVNFCHYWHSHTFPKCCTHGSRQKHQQIRQLLMTAGCSGWPKARRQQPVSACEKKESPAEPCELLVNRLGCLGMISHESITLSSGLSKWEEFGSQHASRREGARGWESLCPLPSPPRGDGLLGTRLGCVLSSWQWCVSHRSGEGARAVGTPQAGARWGNKQVMDH